MTYNPPTLQPLVCPNCRYDANGPSAELCEVCGHPLRAEKLASALPQTKPLIAIGCLGLALLLSVAGGTYLLGRNVGKTPKPTENISKSSSIRLYDSMQDVQDVPKGLFDYAGAVTFANLTAHGMHSAIAQKHPNFRLRYIESVNAKPGSGTAINLLLNGQTSFAQTARPLKDAEYKLARARGFLLEQVPVFIDGIAFYTHPDIKIPGLSINQVKNIFTGKITNWKQVGGPDLFIVPFSQDPKASSVISLLLDESKGQRLGPNVKIIQNITEAIRKVSSTPGGISYSSPSLAIHQKTVRPLGVAKKASMPYVSFMKENRVNVEAFKDDTYPLTRRLFVVFRRDGTLDENGTLDEMAGIAYANLLLSNEGQRIIEKAGFAAIR
jgi:phosphate transport system substrate-binding protein